MLDSFRNLLRGLKEGSSFTWLFQTRPLDIRDYLAQFDRNTRKLQQLYPTAAARLARQAADLRDHLVRVFVEETVPARRSYWTLHYDVPPARRASRLEEVDAAFRELSQQAAFVIERLQAMGVGARVLDTVGVVDALLCAFKRSDVARMRAKDLDRRDPFTPVVRGTRAMAALEYRAQVEKALKEMQDGERAAAVPGHGAAAPREEVLALDA